MEFRLEDYRETRGAFDRVVSVGMFEHVGPAHFQTYFAKIASLLTEDGVALIHTIGRPGRPGALNPWITKHIFPGGYVPAFSEIMVTMRSSGLFVTDVEVLRMHYAETLKAWPPLTLEPAPLRAPSRGRSRYARASRPPRRADHPR